MKDINKLFFELIRVAIGNQVCLSHTPRSTSSGQAQADEWGELYAMAKKQSLVGICFAGVQRLQAQEQCPPEMLYLQWMGMAAKIQQRNEVVNRQCAELAESLKLKGYRSSILKGQGIATLYKLRAERGELRDLSLLRQSGDIDIYVDCGREKAIEYARSMQDEVEWDYKHLHLKVFKDTEVEMHYRPEILLDLCKNRKLQRWFERTEVQEQIFCKQGYLVAPSVEFNAFFILLHIYRHFLYEGVGLRQLMDYYFVLRTQINDERLMINDFGSADRELPKIDRKLSVNALFEEFGMMRFAKGILWIMQYVFGLDKEYLLCEPDEKEGRYILSQVMQGGNFGHHDNRLNKAENKFEKVRNILRHNCHLIMHYPSDVLWAPVWIVWHKCWKLTRK